MDDREREELYDDLVSAIEDAGLGWVSDEVAELIAQGADETTASSQIAGQEARKPAELVAAYRSHTPWERIDLLLSALQRVVEDSLSAEESISAFLESEQSHRGDRRDMVPTFGFSSVVRHDPPTAFVFQSEFNGTPSRSAFGVDNARELPQRRQAIQSLLAQIEEIRQEASA